MAGPRATDVADLISTARRELTAACLAMPAERFAAPQAGEEWSAAQVMAHVIESEDMNLAMLERMRQMENPTIGRIEHYADRRLGAVAEHGQDSRDVAVSRFRAQGERVDARLRSLDEGDLDRPGQHLRFGPATIASMLHRLANHVRDHAEQIRRLAGAAV